MSFPGTGVRFALHLAALASAATATAAETSSMAPRPAHSPDATLNQEDQSWPRYLHEKLGLPREIDLAVDQRTRVEHLENPFRPGEPNTQTQVPQRTRLRLVVDAPASPAFLLELQDSRTFNAGPDDFTVNGVNRLDLLQFVVSTRASDLFGSGLRADVSLGRLTLDVGSRRLVARNGFRNTTNAFDGVHLQIAPASDRWRLRSFYTRPVERNEGVFDDPAWSDSRFWGVALEDLGNEWLRLDLAYFDFEASGSATRLRTVDLRVHRPPEAGQVDYELELIGQAGDVGPGDQRAFATHAELGYSFDAPWSPRLAVQFDYASGTSEPDDPASRTFVPLFGARRFDLVPTGIFGPFLRSNISSPGLRIGFLPRTKLRVDLKLRYWQLAEAEGAFVAGGVQDPTGNAGRELGTDVEFRLRWDPAPWVGIDMGYARWFKGSYLESAPGVSSTANANHFYLQTRFRF